MSDYIQIGHFARTKGYKGELGIKLILDDPFILEDVGMVFLEANKKYVPYALTKIHITPKGHANVFLEDVDGEEAEKMVKRTVFLPRKILEEYEESTVIFQDMVGYEVEDQQLGVLGEINAVIEHPGNTLLQIKKVTGDVLIPLVDAFVLEINDKDKKVLTNLPEGLVDLNL